MQPDEPAVAVAERERPEPFYGIADNLIEEIDAGLITDSTDDLAAGGASDILCTIVGMQVVKGGEERPSRDDPSKTYTQPDRIDLCLRIDNQDDLGLDYDTVHQYFSLGKLVTGKDGQPRRAKPNRNSGYGIWLVMMEGLGISSTPDRAFTFQFSKINDLFGLSFHRQRQEVQTFGDRTMTIDAPIEIFGFDNDVREQHGLPPAYTVEQARALADAAPAKAVGKK